MSTTVTLRLTRVQYEQVVTMLYDDGPQTVQVENSYSVAVIPHCVLSSVRQTDDGAYECVFVQTKEIA